MFGMVVPYVLLNGRYRLVALLRVAIAQYRVRRAYRALIWIFEKLAGNAAGGTKWCGVVC